MRRGAVDYLPKPFTPDQVRLAADRVLETRRLRQRLSELEHKLAGADPEAWLESGSVSVRSLLAQVRRAASADAVVLLRGESGTGKNVLAQWIRALGRGAIARSWPSPARRWLPTR
jgi:two-component system, NtrC family, response regulator AlgB